MFAVRYTYRPSGGPISLHRYRKAQRSGVEERANRVAALADRLGLPHATLSLALAIFGLLSDLNGV